MDRAEAFCREVAATPYAAAARVTVTQEVFSRVFVGGYESSPGSADGGIHVFDLSAGGELSPLSHVTHPGRAASLAWADVTRTLYAVDERKTDGRGPIGPEPAVWAFRVEPRSGSLNFLAKRFVPGSMPGYLCMGMDQKMLLSANHGAFEHVERIRRSPEGSWETTFAYDDSSVVAFSLGSEGVLSEVESLHLRQGHGQDPNDSPQAGGHAQASPHAHCVEVDPSGRWAVVCDKGTDEVVVLDLANDLTVRSTLRMPPATGCRHVTFDSHSDRAYMTCEISSEVVSLRFDAVDGSFELLDQRPSVLPGFDGLNEPAAVRVRPDGRFVYLNNRGEDSLCWWSVDAAGRLERRGSVELARSEHPGVATRSFAFNAAGNVLIVDDLPANLLKVFQVDMETGELLALGAAEVQGPAFVHLVDLPA